MPHQADETKEATLQNGCVVNGQDTRIDTGQGGQQIQHPGFRIIRNYAQGGLGRVWLAHDEGLQRNVAIKDALPDRGDTKEARARLLREARATGTLEHPNIVPVYNIGFHEDGRPFYVMRFVEGKTYRDAIRDFHDREDSTSQSAKRIEFRRLVLHLLDSCRAVSYAHDKGLLHRDIKPDNIMIGTHDETLVLDWGLTREIDDRRDETPTDVEDSTTDDTDSGDSEWTRAGRVLGTPGFMSPEQAAGDVESLGPATDIYGLGATLYYLLVGKRPFQEGLLVRTLEKTQKGQFPAPRSINSKIAKPLEAVCLKAMSTVPAERYRSASKFAEDIEHWLAGERVAAYKETFWERAARWCRNHSTFVCSAIVACLIAGAVWFYFATLIQVMQTEKELTEQHIELANQRNYIATRTQEYADTTDRVKRRLSEKESGFKTANLIDISKASGIETSIRSETELRTLGAGTLTSLSVSKDWEVPNCFGAATLLEICPTNTQVAVSNRRLNVGTEVVQILDTKDGRTIDTLKIRQVAWDVVTQRASQGVSSLSYSPCGRFLAAGLRSGDVVIWDRSTNVKSTPTMRWNVADANANVAFGADSNFLYTGGGTTLKKWNLSDIQQPAATWTPDWEQNEELGPTRILRIHVSESDLLLVKYSQVVTGLDPVVRMLRLDGNTLRPTTKPFESAVIHSAQSRDGRHTAMSLTEHQMELFDAQTLEGQPISRLVGEQKNLPFAGRVSALDFHPTDDWLLSLTGAFATRHQQSKLTIWEASSGAPLYSHPLAAGRCARFSSDGRKIAVIDGQHVVFYSLSPSNVMSKIAVHDSKISSIDFVADTNILACVGAVDRVEGPCLSFWDCQTGQPQRRRVLSPSFAGVAEIAAHPSDDRLIAVASRENDSVELWDVDAGQVVNQVTLHAQTGCVFSRDGEHLFATGREQWPALEYLDCLGRWHSPTLAPAGGWLNWAYRFRFKAGGSFSCLDAGRRIAIAGANVAGGQKNQVLRVFRNARPQATVPPTLHFAHTPTSVALSADEETAVVGLRNGDIALVRIDESNLALTEVSRVDGHHGQTVTALEITDAGLIASGGLDQTIRFWTVKDDQLVEQFSLPGFPHPISQLRYNSTGTKLAVLIQLSRSVYVVDIAKLLQEFEQLSIGLSEFANE